MRSGILWRLTALQILSHPSVSLNATQTWGMRSKTTDQNGLQKWRLSEEVEKILDFGAFRAANKDFWIPAAWKILGIKFFTNLGQWSSRPFSIWCQIPKIFSGRRTLQPGRKTQAAAGYLLHLSHPIDYSIIISTWCKESISRRVSSTNNPMTSNPKAFISQDGSCLCWPFSIRMSLSTRRTTVPIFAKLLLLSSAFRLPS